MWILKNKKGAEIFFKKLYVFIFRIENVKNQ